MSIAIHTDPVPLKMDEYGVIRVGSTRLTLDIIIGAYKAGDSPETIVDNFDVVSLSDVYAVIAYYLHHGAEIDAYLEQRQREADELRREIEQSQPYQDLRQRLLARRKKRN